MLGPKCSDSYARSSWWPARTDCFLHPPLLLLCDFSRILPASNRASMSERGCEVPSWWLALNSCNDFIHHMESRSALLSYQSDVSAGGCRNQGGKKKKKSEAPSHICSLCFHSGQTGKVRWKVRLLGDKLELSAPSLSDFLVQREALMAFLLSFLFLCNGLLESSFPLASLVCEHLTDGGFSFCGLGHLSCSVKVEGPCVRLCIPWVFPPATHCPKRWRGQCLQNDTVQAA